jgi:hypothetical protein
MPLFVMYNTILCGNSACSSGADGYHFVSPTTAGQQVYAVADYDLTGDLTSIDSMAESHEFAEATNDPMTVNPVPTWGYVGQDPASCQQNLETGDPLGPGFPGSPSSVADTYTVSSVSHTFHFQDEAYHSWFFREASPPTSKNVATTLGSGPYSMFGFFSAASSSTVCPGQPTGVSAVQGNGQAKVSWTAGPGPVTGYAVVPYIGSTPQTPQAFSSTATTETVTGLSNKTSYTFTVLARHTNSQSGDCPYDQMNLTFGSGFDCSTESLPSNSIVAGTPAAPTGVNPVPISGGAMVSWTAPANNGSPITKYVITPFLNGVAEAPKTFNSNATTESVTGLTKGQPYTFKVAAINANGTGTNSAMSISVAPK